MPSSPELDTRLLDDLVGYDVRRASLTMTAAFGRHLAGLGLGPVLFTILLLISANPGVRASQLCAQLDLHSSNLVGMIKQLAERGLIERRPHPGDIRARGLHLTEAGQALTGQARELALQADLEGTRGLDAQERRTLAALLRRIHRG